jgi:hypothetical protein
MIPLKSNPELSNISLTNQLNKFNQLLNKSTQITNSNQSHPIMCYYCDETTPQRKRLGLSRWGAHHKTADCPNYANNAFIYGPPPAPAGLQQTVAVVQVKQAVAPAQPQYQPATHHHLYQHVQPTTRTITTEHSHPPGYACNLHCTRTSATTGGCVQTGGVYMQMSGSAPVPHNLHFGPGVPAHVAYALMRQEYGAPSTDVPTGRAYMPYLYGPHQPNGQRGASAGPIGGMFGGMF